MPVGLSYPTNIAMVPANSQVTFTFGAASGMGGMVVTGYDLLYSTDPNSTVQWNFREPRFIYTFRKSSTDIGEWNIERLCFIWTD